ncbi:MAG: DUF1540 domain-containing protein [Clostridia bacterium]
MKDQSIKCDVCACAHHDNKNCCKLGSITVTCSPDCKTAHYCGDYKDAK